MDAKNLLIDLFGRIPEEVHVAVDGLTTDDLTRTAVTGTNPIGWLVWHLTRGHDAQIAEVFGLEQLWTTGDYAHRFGLEPDPDNHGYGHTAAEVAAVRPESVDALLEYFAAAHERTNGLLEGLSEGDLDRIVDEHWDPPVTLGVRLISIADDAIQHAGQAAYLRGLLGL
jgi:hypothetical protein